MAKSSVKLLPPITVLFLLLSGQVRVASLEVIAATVLSSSKQARPVYIFIDYRGRAAYMINSFFNIALAPEKYLRKLKYYFKYKIK